MTNQPKANQPKASHTKQLKLYYIIPYKDGVDFNLFLKEDANELPYQQKYFSDKKNYVHKNGQRKLFITELYFLTQYSKGLVVYVGSSPGLHIKLHLDLFPNLSFHLYDGRKHEIKKGPRVEIFQQYFTDVDAMKYVPGSEFCILTEQQQKEPIIFISDIRTMEGYEDNEKKAINQELVEKDMNLQAGWVKIINPTAYSLKFKLNWNKQHQTYLDGQILFQPWISPYSMETRLLGEGNKEKVYDCVKYEQQMFYYNIRTRFQKQKRNPGYVYPDKYCQCADCTLEASIINLYVKAGITNFTVEQVMDKIMKGLLIQKDINETTMTPSYQ